MSNTFWKHIPACDRDALIKASFTRCSNLNRLSCRSNLSVLFKIQCNWLHPGGTPGSYILIKLICEMLTMWVFRCLVIWCERSLCFPWKDTGGAGTCFSKTLQEIIAVELSWVRAIINDSVCLFPHGTPFLPLIFSFWWWPAKVFFPSRLLSSAIRNLRNFHNHPNYEIMFSGEWKGQNWFSQMLFLSCTLVNRIFSKISQ